ncbi:MAG TPA: 2-hydroxyacid dehydrogenase [Eoetvoesiella sp.]
MTQQKPSLLQLLPFFVLPEAEERLARDFNVIQLWEEPDPDAAILAHQDSITVLVTSAMTPTPASLIDRLPNLRAICSNGVGYDAIDVKHAQQKGIQVSNTPDVLNDCVADLAWGLILTSARGLGRAERHVRANQWGTAQLPLGSKVTGKKLGIVGLGRVGLAIAERAAGFRMDVRYHNRRARTDTSWTYESSLAGLARWADFLVIATVGGASTRHLIDQSILEALGPRGILINIARGSVVDEAALVNMLENGRLGGAGLDVFEDEPNVPDALKNLDNVVILPHIASATIETRQAMASLVLDNVDAFSKTGRVITPVVD